MINNSNLPPLRARTISIGYNGIVLVSEDQLSETQLGYSVHPNGKDLTGDSTGDWKRDWIVIGYDTLVGDPIFIDTSRSDYPVYSAEHGQGSWEPDLISYSYEAFQVIIDKLELLSRDREDPVKMEENPITNKEFDDFVSMASSIGKLEDSFYWELLVTNDDDDDD